jgi:hypothetical protein
LAFSVSQALSWLDTNIGVAWTAVVVASIGVLLGLRRLYWINLNDLAGYRDDPGGLAVAQDHANRDPTAKYVELYRRSLQRVLDWLEARLGDTPWSAHSLDWCLRISIFYPIVSLTAIWTLTGIDSSGVGAFLPSKAPALWRMLSLAIVVAAFLAFLKVSKIEGRRGRFWLICICGVAFLGASSTSIRFGYLLANVVPGVDTIPTTFLAGVIGFVVGLGPGPNILAVVFAFVGVFGGLGAGSAVVVGAVFFGISISIAGGAVLDILIDSNINENSIWHFYLSTGASLSLRPRWRPVLDIL